MQGLLVFDGWKDVEGTRHMDRARLQQRDPMFGNVVSETARGLRGLK